MVTSDNSACHWSSLLCYLFLKCLLYVMTHLDYYLNVSLYLSIFDKSISSYKSVLANICHFTPCQMLHYKTEWAARVLTLDGIAIRSSTPTQLLLVLFSSVSPFQLDLSSMPSLIWSGYLNFYNAFDRFTNGCLILPKLFGK